MLRCLLIATLLAIAPLAAFAVEDTQGDYIAAHGNPYYTVVHGQLYANDGMTWYVLRRPQFDSGLIAGMPFGKQERWCKVGGSRITIYLRTPSTFRNCAKKPVMCQGSNF